MRIGRYEVIGTLGSGGMSSVSLARTETGGLVVLKRQISPSEDGALLDEARVGIRLRHPNIVDHLDLFMHEGRPVLVVEYVSGATLADLKAQGPLPVGVILRIGKQISDALHYIHEATEEDGRSLNMLHRDVTPANIMIGADGNARLIDFGIARASLTRSEVTREGVIKGTLRYLAPELLEDNARHSVATDLWGLGMSLWEAALGRLAFHGDDPMIYATIVSGRHLQLEPGENVDPILRMAVAQILSHEPRCRPPSAQAAALVFEQHLPSFGDTQQLASEWVESSVGPEVQFTEKTSLHDAQLLVNRAAASYGSPKGDWSLAEDVVASRTNSGRQDEPDVPLPEEHAFKVDDPNTLNIPELSLSDLSSPENYAEHDEFGGMPPTQPMNLDAEQVRRLTMVAEDESMEETAKDLPGAASAAAKLGDVEHLLPPRITAEDDSEEEETHIDNPGEGAAPAPVDLPSLPDQSSPDAERTEYLRQEDFQRMRARTSSRVIKLDDDE